MSDVGDVWSDFPVVDTPAAASVSARIPVEPYFPEWTVAVTQRLPVGLKLSDFVEMRRSGAQASPSLQAVFTEYDNEALGVFMAALEQERSSWAEKAEKLKAHFASSPALIKRLKAVRNGAGKFGARIRAEFGVFFESHCVSALAGLVTVNLDVVHTVPVQSARDRQEHLLRREREREERLLRMKREKEEARAREAAHKARMEAEFMRRVGFLVDAGNADDIFDFAFKTPRFMKMIGLEMKAIDGAADTPPAHVWSTPAEIEVSPETKDAILRKLGVRWEEARKIHLLNEKRAAAARKGVETRQRNQFAKARRELEELALRVAEARVAGPASLLAIMDADARVETLFRLPDQDALKLVFTDEERVAVEARENEKEAARRKALKDAENRKGLWRKDVLARNPWIKDSEIERLVKNGHLLILRTELIRKRGVGWIDARLYDPVSLSKLTKVWMEEWRKKK